MSEEEKKAYNAKNQASDGPSSGGPSGGRSQGGGHSKGKSGGGRPGGGGRGGGPRGGGRGGPQGPGRKLEELLEQKPPFELEYIDEELKEFDTHHGMREISNMVAPTISFDWYLNKNAT